ncbi:MAG TPA: hypothetical protein VGS21_06455 [Acidimicrobiales bacterium]|nr:hypothetical protein [Acidimicrobiales bacterium]
MTALSGTIARRSGAAQRAATTPAIISRRSVQIVLGVLWLLDGILQLQPKMLGTSFATQIIEPSAAGQPGLVAWPINEMARLVLSAPAATDLVFAAVQIVIGLGLLRRQTVRPALMLSFAWAGGVWLFGEGLGMVLTGNASPLTGAPGAVLLYALIGLIVWPAKDSGHSGAATESVRNHLAKLAWTTLWLGEAVLWLLPGNSAAGSVSSQLQMAAASSPAFVQHIQTSVGSALQGDGAYVAAVLAVVSVVVGIGPLVTRRRSQFLILGAALSLDFWVLGQSMGGLTTGIATDVNAGPLFVLLALAVLSTGTVDGNGQVRSRLSDDGLRPAPLRLHDGRSAA